ncbi:MAG: hypothetical protein IVW53_09015 [Chloroflexi bacterium]|nr:hypothetical protein [Chloroflexota bacterium]
MWHWTEAYSQAAGFATWVLKRDGLRVPPFDVHPPGDRVLRSLGLDEAAWGAWIEAIVRAEDRSAEAMSAIDLRLITPRERRDLKELYDRCSPVASWVGDAHILSTLEGLWGTYQPIGEAWARTISSTRRHSRISAGQERRLWRQLQPFHDRLPTLHVYLVDYVQLVALPIPPISCVVGIGAPDPEGRAYVDLVTAAAGELATIQRRGASTS